MTSKILVKILAVMNLFVILVVLTFDPFYSCLLFGLLSATANIQPPITTNKDEVSNTRDHSNPSLILKTDILESWVEPDHVESDARPPKPRNRDPLAENPVDYYKKGKRPRGRISKQINTETTYGRNENYSRCQESSLLLPAGRRKRYKVDENEDFTGECYPNANNQDIEQNCRYNLRASTFSHAETAKSLLPDSSIEIINSKPFITDETAEIVWEIAQDFDEKISCELLQLLTEYYSIAMPMVSSYHRSLFRLEEELANEESLFRFKKPFLPIDRTSQGYFSTHNLNSSLRIRKELVIIRERNLESSADSIENYVPLTLTEYKVLNYSKIVNRTVGDSLAERIRILKDGYEANEWLRQEEIDLRRAEWQRKRYYEKNNLETTRAAVKFFEEIFVEEVKPYLERDYLVLDDNEIYAIAMKMSNLEFEDAGGILQSASEYQDPLKIKRERRCFEQQEKFEQEYQKLEVPYRLSTSLLGFCCRIFRRSVLGTRKKIWHNIELRKFSNYYFDGIVNRPRSLKVIAEICSYLTLGFIKTKGFTDLSNPAVESTQENERETKNGGGITEINFVDKANYSESCMDAIEDETNNKHYSDSASQLVEESFTEPIRSYLAKFQEQDLQAYLEDLNPQEFEKRLKKTYGLNAEVNSSVMWELIYGIHRLPTRYTRVEQQVHTFLDQMKYQSEYFPNLLRFDALITTVKQESEILEEYSQFLGNN